MKYLTTSSMDYVRNDRYKKYREAPRKKYYNAEYKVVDNNHKDEPKPNVDNSSYTTKNQAKKEIIKQFKRAIEKYKVHKRKVVIKKGYSVSRRVAYGVHGIGSEKRRAQLFRAVAALPPIGSLLSEPNTYITKRRGDNKIRMLGRYKG